MKVIYNNKEIMNNTNNYETLLNLPMINSATLQGVKTLNDINAYSKQQVDELIGNSRAIEIVATLPTNLIENTLYYVGPDANDFYDVYLVDEVRNVINIGTSQFGEYFAGTGIDIDADNYIHAKIDNKTVVVDSEGNLHANLDMDSVPVMVGTTASVSGEKGLVPQPTIGMQNKMLKSNGTWDNSLTKEVVDIFFPVGSIYLTIGNTNPSTFLTGTTWSKLSTGKTIWNTATGGGTARVSGAPNATGNDGSGHPAHQNGGTGIFYSPGGGMYGTWEGSGSYLSLGIDASRQNSIYKDGQTEVQPPAIKVCM